jgi:DNA mismatch repair protein MutL
MPKIKQLSLHEAHKIAAGEVVERPANIVKELLENSLDAGATHISLYIEDGGKKLIRIVDNGCGMDEQDAQLCFAKHATSKITHIDQLESVSTFGFRGEALASVAAVARVTLITKQAESQEGVCVTVAESAITSTQPIAAVTGTDISVHDLFYNIPARKKFLKKSETEWNHIVQLFQAFCLAFGHIHFSLFHENKNIFNCPPAATLSTRFAQLFHQLSAAPQTMAQTLLPIENNRIDNTIHVTGTITTQAHLRYDRNQIFFFVNNRWVKNFALSNALLKGYAGLIPPGKYPMACVKITVDPTLVDINIHPRKEEVAFLHPQKIAHVVTTAALQAFEKKTSSNLRATSSPENSVFSRFSPRDNSPLNTQVQAQIQSAQRAAQPVFTPFDFDALETSQNSHASSANTQNYHAQNFSPELAPEPAVTNHDFAEQSLYTGQAHTLTPDQLGAQALEFSDTANPPAHSKHRSAHEFSGINLDHAQEVAQEARAEQHTIYAPSNSNNTALDNTQHTAAELADLGFAHAPIIGQYNATYILIEQEDGLLLVDQHAAHERILYELFASRFHEVPTINLLFPIIIELSGQDYATIAPHLDIFTQNQIAIEPFGEQQLIIKATPVHLKDVCLQELVQHVIGCIHESDYVDHGDFAKAINEKLHAQMACKAAVKAGDVLTREQMQRIITDLHKTPNRFTCPHGRPTSLVFSLHDIEKKFKRKK